MSAEVKTVIIFKNNQFTNKERYDELYESLVNQVRTGVVLIPNGVECIGWVYPEGEVKVELVDSMPDTKEDWRWTNFSG